MDNETRLKAIIAAGQVQQIAQTTVKPEGVPEVTIDELERRVAAAKKKGLMIGLGIGAVALGVGFLAFRRKGRR